MATPPGEPLTAPRSGPPQLLDTTSALLMAVFSALNRSVFRSELASTTRILQSWQISCAAWISRSVSIPQPPLRSTGAVRLLPPLWLTTLKHDVGTVELHLGKFGRPK